MTYHVHQVPRHVACTRVLLQSVGRLLALGVLVTLAILPAGCILVAAGAGAGAAVAYTNRGASASVPGSVDVVFDKTRSAFTALGIGETGQASENSGALRRLMGRTGDNEITVELRRSSESVTAVEVVAKKSVVEFDRDLAKRVLERIVGK